MEDHFKNDEYADLNARARSTEAVALVQRVFDSASRYELENGLRKNERSGATAPKFKEALERFVGNLLLSKADDEGTGRLYLSMDNTAFTGDLTTVSYRNFKSVVTALSALGLIDYTPGKGRFNQVDWGHGDRQKWQDKGWAARFKATEALESLAKHEGVTLANIDAHFKLEPPRRPLVLRAGSTYTEGHKLQGARMEFERAGKALKLEEELKELNAFLASTEIGNATHYYFIRGFNEGNHETPYTWTRGGRLYSQGGVHTPSYQQLAEEERAKIMLNGEPTCELDISACNLTIFHALVGRPLDLSIDPYERVMPGHRSLVKSYMTALFGNDAPLDHWPKDAVKELTKQYGLEPAKLISASDMGQRVMAAYPALKAIGQDGVRWPNLMHREATSIINTVRSLMQKGVPSLPIHDGIIVPMSAVSDAVNALIGYFWRVVGVVPVVRAKNAPEAVQRIVHELGASSRSNLKPRSPDVDLL